MLECFRYLEPTFDNQDAFSVALLEIQWRACAAIDSALHVWYVELKIGSKDSPKLPDYFPLRDRLNLRFDVELKLQRSLTAVTVAPFRNWTEQDRVPSWWTAHNRTKHALGEDTFKLANLLNALSALGALYLVLSDRETVGTHPITTRVFLPVW